MAEQGRRRNRAAGSKRRAKTTSDTPSLFDGESNGAGSVAVEDREFTREMETAYLEYSMSVIVARALPDVRDGLKPVQRRILWGMQTSGVRATGPHRKCAKVVGEVMGSYHPHGDSAIYDALVRMAQPFSYYVPLVDGQGNFGSPGFPPAAMRYTECRMTPTAEQMLADIGEETVDFVPNYDGETTEPAVLPSAFPNLLVNGAAGIAVGMATSIPTHNPVEVLDAALMVLDSPQVTTKRLLRKLKGPDFTTGCDIIDAGGELGIAAAYETGAGRVTVRASVEIEAGARGSQVITFRNLPPAVSVSQVAEQIVDQVKKGKLASLSNVVDASDKEGQQLQVHTKKGHSAPAAVAELFRLTRLEDTFAINMRALVDGVPRVLSVAEMLRAFCDHRMEVVLRRSVFRRQKAEARRHIVQALMKALDRIDEVIAAIRRSADAAAAKEALIDLLDIDAEQAQAIIEMQLRRLTGLETQALADELEALNAEIRTLKAIIDDEERRRGVVRSEMQEVRAAYVGLKRRSRIVSVDTAELEAEAEEAEEGLADLEVQVRVLRGGYVEVTPPGDRRKTWRGSDPHMAPVLDRVVAMSDRIAVVTEDGRAWGIPLLDVPAGRRVALRDLSDAPRDARIVFAFPASVTERSGGTGLTRTLALVTSDGKAKRLEAADAVASTRSGVQVMRLDDDARVVGAALVTDADALVLVSSDGHAVRVTAGDLPAQGRSAGGVRAQRLAAEAVVVAAALAPDEAVLVCGTADGWVTSVDVAEIPVHARGAKGVLAARTDKGRGSVTGAAVTERKQPVWLVDSDHKVHGVEAKAAKRGGQGRHVTGSVADVFA
ncbi:MAG: DNA topoisomerase 4 subunit A [Acidimicrobiia bacterium]|nr:DNA topoisomerase 4 subunit A [Acidimicrobiia bacterium]